MLLFWIHIAFFCVFRKSVFGYTAIECNAKTTDLANGEFIKLQSPNYPKSFEDPKLNGYTSCINNFTRSDGKVHLWLVLLTGVIPKLRIKELISDGNIFQDTTALSSKTPSWFSHLSNSPKLYFVQPFVALPKLYENKKWAAFQALIYAPDNIQTCPFSEKTFELSDDTEIIPIASNFFYPNFNPQILSDSVVSCSWTFLLPTLFKLKINIKVMNFEETQSLSIKSDNQSSIKLNSKSVQYFEGSKFLLFYNTTKFQNYSTLDSNEKMSRFGFAGIVTAVKIGPIKDGNHCEDVNGTFSYFNSTTGYDSDTVCQKQIKVFANETIYLHYFGFTEDNVDSLIVTDNKDNQTIDLTKNTNLFIDEKAGNITIKFQSDGSISQAGFSITSENVSCKCNSDTFVLACLNHAEKRDLDLNESIGYCSNMKCKREIIQNVTCPYQISYILIPNFQLRNLSNDSIKIMQNNETLAVITPETKVREHFIINSKNTNITVELEADSNLFGIYPTPSSKFSIVSFPELKTEVHHLSLTKFSYTIEIAFIKDTAKLITVIAPNEYTLDMFMAENIYFKDETANIIREFLVYESNSTKNLIFYLDQIPYHYKYKTLRHYRSTSNTISLFIFNWYFQSSEVTIFFRLREVHAKNCPSTDNVITTYETPFGMSSSSTGSCILTVLNTNSFTNAQIIYVSFSTNSLTNIKVYDTNYSNISFLEFNAETASSWKNLLFYGSSNSFLIPSNATLNFTTVIRGDVYDISYQNVKKGILTSSNLYDPSKTSRLDSKVLVPQNSTCKFSVKFLDVSDKSLITINTTDKNGYAYENGIKLTAINQTLIISDKNATKDYYIFLNYKEPEKEKHGYIVEFVIINYSENKFNFIAFLLLFSFLLLLV